LFPEEGIAGIKIEDNWRSRFARLDQSKPLCPINSTARISDVNVNLSNCSALQEAVGERSGLMRLEVETIIRMELQVPVSRLPKQEQSDAKGLFRNSER
jgi:hypothetical protein